MNFETQALGVKGGLPAWEKFADDLLGLAPYMFALKMMTHDFLSIMVLNMTEKKSKKKVSDSHFRRENY